MARDIVFTPQAAAPPATYSQAVKGAGLSSSRGRPRQIRPRVPSWATPSRSRRGSV